MWVTGDHHIRSARDVADTDVGWENAVLTQYSLLRFHKDHAALPPNVAAQQEKIRQQREQAKQ